MPRYSHVYDPRERRMVAAADWGLRLLTAPERLWPFSTAPATPSRILLLRLERIGDLLMTLPAIAAIREHVPGARIDLAVGGWNRDLAELIPGVDRLETVNLAWLARGDGPTTGLAAAARQAVSWRERRYDVGINFEPDLRSHLLLRLSGARRRVGFDNGGGGPLLSDRENFDPGLHTAVNALRLVARAFDVPSSPLVDRYLAISESPGPHRLVPPERARQSAVELLRALKHPVVGVHASGGRPIKQWPVERFAEIAARLSRERGASLVLTGSAEDRALVDRVRGGLPLDAHVLDVSGRLDLATLAAVLERLDVLITGDTGPMHLADAVGTPVVAVFGLSDPRRYGPLSRGSRVVRIDLPCSPCNRVRRPPLRCVGATPDCLEGISVEQVYASAVDVLERGVRSARADKAAG